MQSLKSCPASLHAAPLQQMADDLGGPQNQGGLRTKCNIGPILTEAMFSTYI